MRWAGTSRFLWAGGENHRGGETVNTQSRDVDLVTAVSGKLKEDTERERDSLCFYSNTECNRVVKMYFCRLI